MEREKKINFYEDKLAGITSEILTELEFADAVVLLANNLTSAIVFGYYSGKSDVKKSYNDFVKRIDFFLEGVREALLDKYKKIWEMEL